MGKTEEFSMKPQMVQRPLMFRTERPYASAAYARGGSLVERSVSGMPLNEPADASVQRPREAVAKELVGNAAAGERPARREDLEALNPLRDQPSTAMVKAVRRFGLVGLVTGAVFAATARWWHSLTHRKH
jgi:hypothetical protein